MAPDEGQEGLYRSGPDGRQALVGAIFARLDVMGFERLEYELTPDAIDLGLDAVLPPILELESQIDEFGRGERTRHRRTDMIDRAAAFSNIAGAGGPVRHTDPRLFKGRGSRAQNG
jgi:hypothetical protein